jgi:hypothetical protein
MSVQVPTVGSRVRVTTIYPNTYAYRNEYDNYVTTTREGFVVQSLFNDPFYFAVETGDPEYPVSEFNSKSPHVVQVEVLTGETKTVENTNKAWKVKSEDGNTYLVQRIDGKFYCTCKGFEFHKDCKHIGMVNQK